MFRYHENLAHLLANESLLIAHFPDDIDVSWIMSNRRKLNETDYFVSKDYSIEVRRKRVTVRAVKETGLSRGGGRNRMPLVNDRRLTHSESEVLGDLLRVDI